MLQEIYPKTYYPEYKNQKPATHDYLCAFMDNKILLKRNSKTKELEIPKFIDIENISSEIYDAATYVCAIDDKKYYVLDAKSLLDSSSLKDFTLEKVYDFRAFEPRHHAFAGVTASQIYRWMKSRKYCGVCGSKTVKSEIERAMICPKCRHIEYPKIAPAIIVAVTDNDRLLLTKNLRSVYKSYALVAGFVEIGETLEDAVRREVMEEVGLKIKNIKPYKSQPWALSDTLMLAFTAELDGDDTITLQTEELSEAGWFHRSKVPILEGHISVGQELIENFKNGKF